MPRNSDPKLPLSTGVSPELFVHAEKFALDNHITRGENADGSSKPNLSALLYLAIAAYTEYPIPVAERAAISAQTAEEKRAAAKAAEDARRKEARARVDALRAKASAPTAAPHEHAGKHS